MRQVIKNVVVVNPGFLSKRKAAGTYAKLTIHPPNLTEAERSAGKYVAHKLHERARVEIVRI